MKVDDVYSFIDPSTGERVTVRREIEIDGTVEENAARSRRASDDFRRMEIRADVRELLAEQALGEDVTERLAELRSAWAKLRG